MFESTTLNNNQFYAKHFCMKKFYMLIAVAFVSASLLLSFSSKLQAQCPAGPQKVFLTVGYDATGQPVNTVYVEGFQPNGAIALWEGVTPIFGQESTQAATDANGSGRIIYNPIQTPTSVTVTTINGTCAQPVPVASATCSGNIVNAVFPPIGGEPGFCNIFFNNNLLDADVRVFDASQNLVPTITGVYPTTDAAGSAGYPYDCANFTASLTVCNASGCCSYVVTAAASLPIKLKYFTAKLSSNKEVILNWASELEIHSDKFVVEKSLDGRNFKPLADIKSGGNSATTRTYAYTDGSFSSIAYYRLKMVDIDGKTELSKVVYVNARSASGTVTQIFPNPFKSDIQIIGINSSDLNSKNVKVFSSTGQQINFKITGANAISLDEHAPRGMYILAIKEQRFKLIKE